VTRTGRSHVADDSRDPALHAANARNKVARSKLIVPTLFLITALMGQYVATPSSAETADPTPDPLIGQLVSQVDTTTLAGYVADLSGERPVLVGGEPYTIQTRYSYSQGIKKATQYLYEHFDALGLDTRYHEYTQPGLIWRNVEATLPGLSDPDRIYIICAHADSTSGFPTVDAPGADDNASGTAAVMVAADIFSRYQFDYTIRFVTFSGEEQGMLGSAAYAARARALGENIVGVINLDMIGYDAEGGPEIDLHAGTDAGSLALASTFSETVAIYDLDLLPQIIGQGALSRSDHGSFWDNDYPAILGIEDYYPGLHDFNPCYHSPAACDDLLEYMNLDYFSSFTRAALATLATLAGPVAATTPTASPTTTLTPTTIPTATPTIIPTASATQTPTATRTWTSTPSPEPSAFAVYMPLHLALQPHDS